ncbi:MAG TPA: glycosyltransferase family 9 protein [Melioribacteraceae bacterium]|nr:glycosyltransferase family 9 protein [Melioribacteraceae bacterium]
MISFDNIKYNCIHFKGDIPCKPHKLHNVKCVDNNGDDCKFYTKNEYKILIIKLGAIGDVIRTTPLIKPIKEKYNNCKIYWLTYTPDVIPSSVDYVLPYNFETVTLIKNINFDFAVNLDKDKEACALFNTVTSKIKKGFVLKDGFTAPADKDAEAKFLTGIFDDLNKQNTKHYLEEIFEICGFKYKDEKYVLSTFDEYGKDWDINTSKKIVGFNTGCGGRWSSRLWKTEYWIELAKMLINNNYEVILLGGEQEDIKNKEIANKSGAKYFGYYKLPTFINLVNRCNLVITAVTMAMHITLALNKKIVLFNNIFNKNEFHLFNLGEIVEPTKECKCFYSGKCKNDEYFCMDTITVNKVYETVNRLLK